MQDFRKRRTGRQDWGRIVLGALGVVLLALGAFWAFQGAWGMYQKFALAAAADDASQKELAAQEEEYARVGAAVAALKTTEGVEAGLRERYGVAKPGEGEIDIIRRAATTTGGEGGNDNFFVKIFKAIFVW